MLNAYIYITSTTNTNTRCGDFGVFYVTVIYDIKRCCNKKIRKNEL